MCSLGSCLRAPLVRAPHFHSIPPLYKGDPVGGGASGGGGWGMRHQLRVSTRDPLAAASLGLPLVPISALLLNGNVRY